MCGIAGYYAFGSKLPNKKRLTKLLVNLSERGSDATGFAYVNKHNQLVVAKAPLDAEEFVKTAEWKNLVPPRILSLHTRAATIGDPIDNSNNHPLFNKQGDCICHNGMIRNDHTRTSRDVKDGIVDSFAILDTLSKYDIQRVYDTIHGSYAVSYISTRFPGSVFLFRHDNPIDLYYDMVNDILYYASTKQILKDSLVINKITKRGLDMSVGNFSIPNDMSIEISKKGVLNMVKYKPKQFPIWSDIQYVSTSKSDTVSDTPPYYPPGLFDESIPDANKWQGYCPACGNMLYGASELAVYTCRFCGNLISDEDIMVDEEEMDYAN